MKLITRQEKFKKFMEERGMTVTEFAKFCHISERQAKGLLDGKVTIGLRKVLGILYNMDAKPNELFLKLDFTGKREILLRNICMKELYGIDLTKIYD